MTVERRQPSQVPEKMGGAALGLLIGLTIGGPVGAIVGGSLGSLIAASVGPVLTPVMEAWVGRVREEFRHRGDQIATAAAIASHLSETKVVERLLKSEPLQPLVLRVLDAASRTNSTEKLRALGALLGEAVTNRPRQIDEDLLIVAALNDLEAAHIRVLETVEGPADAENLELRWTATALRPAVSDLTPVGLSAAIGGLVRHGLITSVPTVGETGYEITEFGQAMLRVMRPPS